MVKKLNTVGSGTKTVSIPKALWESIGITEDNNLVNVEFKDGGIFISSLTKEQRYEKLSKQYRPSLDELAK